MSNTVQNIEVGKCKLVDIRDVEVSPFNARDQEMEPTTGLEFEELCESLRSEGLVEPLVVRPTGQGKYETIAGTRRLRALKQVGATEVPVVVRHMEDNDVRIASLVENIHRDNLNENEMQRTLTDIYLESWDQWKPANWNEFLPKVRDRRSGKQITYDPTTEEGKLTLIKQYLDRIVNEEHKINKRTTVHKNRLGVEQFVVPTDGFRELADRIGYAPMRQRNIIAGWGSGPTRSAYDSLQDMDPISRKVFEEDIRVKKLEEDKQKELRRTQAAALRKARNEKKNAKKTNKQIVQEATNRFFKSEENKKQKQKQQEKKLADKRKRRQEEEERKRQEQIAKLGGNAPKPPDPDPPEKFKPYVDAPEVKINPVRAREKIAGLATQLFELLTAQELETGKLDIGEMQAKSRLAEDNMREVATFMGSEQTNAWQQYIIIPLNIALTKYRDILYETAEARKRNDDILKP